MSLPRLRHVFPEWDHFDDEGAPLDEPRQIWRGRMRVVSAQRARKLRRRGVPIMRNVEITSTGRQRHAWFTPIP